jgi:hypothetical protein
MDFAGLINSAQNVIRGLLSAFGSMLLMREWSDSGGGNHLSDQRTLLVVEVQRNVL